MSKNSTNDPQTRLGSDWLLIFLDAIRSAERPRIELRFSSESGWREHALRLADFLLDDLEPTLGGVTLSPLTEPNTFDVTLDAHLLFSASREGGVPEPAELLARVRRSMQLPRPLKLVAD